MANVIAENVTTSHIPVHEISELDLILESLISDAVTIVVRWISFTVVCQAIDVFGVVSNIINVLCFVKQGFKDPINISLLGLSISDLGCLLMLILTNICFTPAFLAADLPFDPMEVQYITCGFTHIAFSRVSAWLTAFIVFERCLCITLPLKVKHIITPKRTWIFVVVVFSILMFSLAPMYVVNKLGMKFVPEKNKTLLGLVFAENRQTIDTVSFAINNIVIPFSAFIIIIICTVIIVIKLQFQMKWRKTSNTAQKVDSVSNRNRKVAKMVVMISIMFIACFSPVCFIFVAMIFEPKLSVDGNYLNLLTLLGAVGLILESINSSANIFIYYHMSSKYRNIFIQLFSRISH